nr:MAG TPA: hypothetical protein [Caudoviricetes sp.]
MTTKKYRKYFLSHPLELGQLELFYYYLFFLWYNVVDLNFKNKI